MFRSSRPRNEADSSYVDDFSSYDPQSPHTFEPRISKSTAGMEDPQLYKNIVAVTGVVKDALDGVKRRWVA